MTKEGENVAENEKVRQKTRRGEDERNKVESLRENTTQDSQSSPRPACHQVQLLLPCSHHGGEQPVACVLAVVPSPGTATHWVSPEGWRRP